MYIELFSDGDDGDDQSVDQTDKDGGEDSFEYSRHGCVYTCVCACVCCMFASKSSSMTGVDMQMQSLYIYIYINIYMCVCAVSRIARH